MSSAPQSVTPACSAGESSGSERIVGNLYRLILNREPESEEAAATLARLPPHDLVAAFLNAGEFDRTVGRALSESRRPWEASFSEPGPDLTEWAAESLPLSEAARAAVRASARSWSALYLALASDPEVQARLQDDRPLTRPRQLAVLRAAAQVEGRLEEAEPGRVRGWALRPAEPDVPVTVEVWINGVFAAARACAGFRRDVQDRFGGAGLAGFDIPLPEAARARFPRMAIEVRPAGEPLVLGRTTVEATPAGADLLLEMRHELRRARETLERLEAWAPHVESRLSSPLSEWDAYRRAWPTAAALERPVAPVAVMVDAGAAPARWLEQTVQSVAGQIPPPAGLAIVVAPSRRLEADDLVSRLGWRGVAAEVVETAATAPADRAGQALARTGDAEIVLLLTAGDVLTEGALAHVGDRFAADSALAAVYVDEDAFSPQDEDADPRERMRTAPRLKPGYDPDLMLQTPYAGPVLAFRRAVLETARPRAEAGGLWGCDLLLGLAPEAIGHIPRVLVTRRPAGDEAAGWGACVARRLGTPVRSHEDLLGAEVLHAVRPPRPPLPTTAAVIIPTRDGLELLRPCVDSILKHAADNRVRAEIIVIDHQSEQAETRAYLDGLTADGLARVIPYDGDFNWARMNNMAAARTEAEVLVFLNNDCVVLTPDWLDELAAQAMRPDVGAVGCRLIYGDGTIQHAGFVARESADAFLTHEGVGQPGSDPGYLGRHVLLRAAAAVTGACMATGAATFRRLGGFDAASFPVEGNDVDLCLRARAEGLKVLYDPYATLYHLESKTRGFNTSAEKQARGVAASRILWARWGERFGRDPGFNPHFDRRARPFTRLRPPPGDAS